ncbi:hypothetical protein [Stenotrophomonas muris]|uniref:hypothetical protein n=1 Tax=Stenotrophomonas muris TaxID=2963283 RepID=UPI00383B0ADF
MSNDKTTLADVQPGGRVRLGDQLRSELLDQAERLERMAAQDRETGESIEQALEAGEEYTPDDAPDVAAGLQHDANRSEEIAALLRKAAAALSAQPSPGGQGDVLAAAAQAVIEAHDDADFITDAQVESLRAALAARQPVGEPITVEAVAEIFNHPEYGLSINWLLENGIGELQVGDVLLVSDRAITDEDGSGEVYTAPPAQAVDLAPDHRGMRVSCSGLLSQVRGGLKSNPELAEMVRQLHGHLNELGKRWYAGDRKVVDEFLQLYVIEYGARRALIDSQAVGNG